MEVQSATEGQTSVSWTPTTTFSETATETVSAIAVGDCLTVTGTPSKKSKTTVAARSITISQPTSSGTCAAGSAARARAASAAGRAELGGAGRTGGEGGTPPSGSFPRGGGSGRVRGAGRADSAAGASRSPAAR